MAAAFQMTPTRIVRLLCGALLLFAISNLPAQAGPLDELDVKRWEKLTRAEYYHLESAEDFYRKKKQYKEAADAYEKFLKHHPKSEGAPYAQLMWSHCHVQLRKMNTALKDGYQTLLEYYPSSPEAPLAAYLMGRTNKDLGDLKSAKKAYAKAMETYPTHLVAAMARLDLVEIATIEKDTTRRAQLLRELTFDVARTGANAKDIAKECIEASRLYAHHSFTSGDFEEGMKSLATSFKEEELPRVLLDHKGNQKKHPNLGDAIHALTGSKDANEKQKGEKLADAAVAWFKTKSSAALADPATKAGAADFWYAAATVQGLARRPDKQKEILDQMLTALGTSDTLLDRIASWYKANNQPEKARETYQKFQDPVKGQAQVAISFVEESQFDKAVDVYRTLAAKDESSNAKWMAEVAKVYRVAKKWDLAIAVYRDLLTTDAAHAADWQWETAETLYLAGRWKDAINTYRGTEKFPTNYDRMAEAQRKLGQWDEAILLYRGIMAGSPSHASKAALDIAQTQEQAARIEDAKKTYKEICRVFPKTPEGSKAHSHLNQKYNINVTLGGAKD